jgi:PAS domain S-box-containing protein
MAKSSNHLPINSSTEQGTIDGHLLTVQAAMINQIAQATLGRLVLDDVLHSIVKQLQDALSVSGCLIVQSEDTQGRARVGDRQHSLAALSVRVATTQQNSKVVPAERLYHICCNVYQYYQSWLTQGKSVSFPGTGQQIPAALQDWTQECGLSGILIVPLLHSSFDIGAIILYNIYPQREWAHQEIAFVQAIADQLAIALTLTALVRQSSTELTKCQENQSVLHESQRRLRAICSQTCQFLGLLTLDGCVLEVSQTALDFTGLQERDLLGRPFWEARWWTPSVKTHKQLQEALAQRLRRSIAAAATGEFIWYEVEVLGSNQEVATLDFSLKPHRDETGQVVLLIFEGRDITDYKQTQLELQASVARNHALLEAIPDAIFRVTRDGIYLDHKAAKQDSRPIRTSEMIGRHLHQVLPTEVAGLIWHHVELTLETNQMQLIEYQLGVNGKTHHFEARLVKSGADEVAVIVQDITERVQVRVALEQLNDVLEIRVAERTAALREANRILRAEIIERRKAEEQLKESEERFRNLVETSSDWVWEVDENAVYTYASPQVKSLLGYEPSEVLGKTPSDFMPSEERQHVAILFAPLIASRQPFTCLENTNIHKEGHAVVLERSGVPIFDAKGTFRGYRGIDRDITERKKSEKEVQFLNSITRAIFESQDFYAALGVALQKVCEATGWDFGEAWVPMADGSALECSPAWYSKTQSLDPFRCASEKLTFPPNIGLPGRVWVSQHPEWRRNVSAESHEVYLRAQLARDVGLKSALGIPIIANEGVLAVLVFYMFESKDEDQRLIELISASTELGLMIQRKQAEGEIRKALEKEKELTELKSRFISMTSHEFRTPLTTIHSSAELLEHYSYKWTEDKKLTHLQRIQASVKHMTKLLNDVLILGKAEAGKLKLNLVPLELENFCRNLVEELQLNDTNQHTIIFTCSKDTRDRLQVSKLNVQRSIRIDPLDSAAQYGNDYAFQPSNLQPSNLPTYPFGERFANNLQPTPSGNADARRLANASLSRTTFNLIPCMDEKLLRQILENLLSNAIKYSQTGSTVEFTLSYLEKQAVFQICDRGIGIPIEDQQRLFETFHRATNVGTIAGTGLGLAIVKKCVDIHQGEIAVESEIGVGTTFTVTLPIYDLVPTYEENSSY